MDDIIAFYLDLLYAELFQAKASHHVSFGPNRCAMLLKLGLEGLWG